MVYSSKRRNVLRDLLMLHFLPVSINFALLGLYTNRVLWAAPWPTTNVLNALQFAAKVHETLMVVSLANILLHHVKYRLLSSTLPLGLATSPFRLLDLTYLWSQEFSAAWWGQGGMSILDVVSILVHVFLFVLAAILGPASAISMLPRLREWRVATEIADVLLHGNTLQIYIGGELSDIYPSRITGSLAPEACDYNDFSQPQTNVCPRYGLEEILQTPLPVTLDFGNNQWVTGGHDNITIRTNMNSEAVPRTISTSFMSLARLNQTVQSIVDMTTAADVVMHFATRLVDYYYVTWWVLGGSSSGPVERAAPVVFKPYPVQPQAKRSRASWKQPYVSSLCSQQRHIPKLSGPISFQFFDSLFPTETNSGSSDYTTAVTLDSALLPTISENAEMDFVSISNLAIESNFTPSAAFIYTYQSNVTLCLVKAAWADSALSITQNSAAPTSVLAWGWLAPYHYSTSQDSGWFNDTNAPGSIYLDLDWLKALDYGTVRNYTSDNRFFKRFAQKCLDRSTVNGRLRDQNAPELKVTCMAYGLSIGITEGLSKVTDHFNVHALGSVEDYEGKHYGPSMTLSPWTRVETEIFLTMLGEQLLHANWTPSKLSPSEIKNTSTRLDFEITGKMYGYGFNDVTIIMAFVVLFIYVATVVLHIIITSFGTSWSSRAWKSLGEYFVLAIQSPAPTSMLDNTGGGVNKLSTWKSRVSVQELQRGNGVGFVIRKRSRPDAENSSEQVSKVRPDWRYS